MVNFKLQGVPNELLEIKRLLHSTKSILLKPGHFDVKVTKIKNELPKASLIFRFVNI